CGERDDAISGAFRDDEAAARHVVEAAVVDVEAGRQAEPGVERERAHERGGCESLRLQKRRERGGARFQSISGVLSVSVLIWIEAGQDGRMRRQCDDRMRMREREA